MRKQLTDSATALILDRPRVLASKIQDPRSKRSCKRILAVSKCKPVRWRDPAGRLQTQKSTKILMLSGFRPSHTSQIRKRMDAAGQNPLAALNNPGKTLWDLWGTIRGVSSQPNWDNNQSLDAPYCNSLPPIMCVTWGLDFDNRSLHSLGWLAGCRTVRTCQSRCHTITHQ